MVTTLTRHMTIEEYEALPSDQSARIEIVRGELVERMSPGIEHFIVAGKIMMQLGFWAEASKQGYVGPEGSYALQMDPLTLRTPDVSYFRAEKRPRGRQIKGVGRFAPDLAVEVISPSERRRDVQAKVKDYLDAGVLLVWTVWPEAREVVAHTPDDEPRTFRMGDTLEFPEVLPGFSCRVNDLFVQVDD